MKIERMIGILSLLLQKEKITTPELAGLRSLDSVSGSSYYSQLMEKIKAGSLSFLIQEDGSLLFESDEDEEGLIAWILSCGNKVTVLEPQTLREHLFAVTSELSKKYRD